MKVLVACEFSGLVRDAFIEEGHKAISCDILPSENPDNPHYMGDVLDILYDDWDLVIAHPPCTYLCAAGARWIRNKKDIEEGITLFLKFTELKCRWCIENPVGMMSNIYRNPNQVIQPWQFGHGETKATCLWLNNLQPLMPENIVSGRVHKSHSVPPSKDRWKERSRTYIGIAKAMAKQWSY